MKIKIVGIIIVAVGLSMIALYSFSWDEKNNVDDSLTIQYHEINSKLQSTLSVNQILMSNPIKISSPESISKYCNFFSDSQLGSVEYCTSTELKDEHGNFLGNVHIVGTTKSASTVIVVAQTDVSMSQLDYVKTLFDDSVTTIVCDCWAEKRPGGFGSVGDWISALKNMHDESKVSQSNIDSLENKDLHLELSANNDGYMWTLVISL